MGAKSVFEAEGPGRQHDTQLVLSQSGYDRSLSDEKIQFLIETDPLIVARELHRHEVAVGAAHCP